MSNRTGNLTNYHSHSLYCDGRANMEDFIRFALSEGFTSYGFSSHAPLPFSTAWTMEWDAMDDYLAEFHRLKAKYAGQIELYIGLEIDYLNKEPGIYSARYMGHETSYREKNANLISRLDGVPKEKRTARFVCAIAAALPDGNSLVTRGTIEGYIGWEECGSNGFGYDPIFYLYENDKSTAELSAEEKNAISHRGKALRQMKKMLEEQE